MFDQSTPSNSPPVSALKLALNLSRVPSTDLQCESTCGKIVNTQYVGMCSTLLQLQLANRLRICLLAWVQKSNGKQRRCGCEPCGRFAFWLSLTCCQARSCA
jgi:hypothetical protein